jgi:uncharacterized protein YkwD
VDQDGGLAFVRLLSASALYCCFSGENLARTFAPETVSAERAHQALMGSPTHRANILEPRFVRLAVGSTRDPEGQVVFAEIFRATAP